MSKKHQKSFETQERAKLFRRMRENVALDKLWLSGIMLVARWQLCEKARENTQIAVSAGNL